MIFENNLFCTIITGNYGQYALALHDSLLQHNIKAKLAVFISKGEVSDLQLKEFRRRKNLQLYFFKDLENFGKSKKLYLKYSEDYHDAYRWGMKPVFINYLLQFNEKVIYLDSDLYFYNSFDFLFDLLDDNKILLNPHWRTIDPHREPTNFKLNFRDGIYNAGFLGASRGAEKAMQWWAKMVLFKCEVNRDEGYYVDQRYLDIMPIHFDGVKPLDHKGCNVANWNKVVCKRTKNEAGEIVINNRFPIVFIHFTNTMLKGIFFENDELLLPYLEEYRDNLLKYSDVDIIEDFHKRGKFKKSRSEDDFKKKPQDTSWKVVKGSKKILKKIYKKLS